MLPGDYAVTNHPWPMVQFRLKRNGATKAKHSRIERRAAILGHDIGRH